MIDPKTVKTHMFQSPYFEEEEECEGVDEGYNTLLVSHDDYMAMVAERDSFFRRYCDRGIEIRKLDGKIASLTFLLEEARNAKDSH